MPDAPAPAAAPAPVATPAAPAAAPPAGSSFRRAAGPIQKSYGTRPAQHALPPREPAPVVPSGNTATAEGSAATPGTSTASVVAPAGAPAGGGSPSTDTAATAPER